MEAARGGPTLAVVVALLASVVLVFSPAAADWLQYGGDAGNTGYSALAGPTDPDIAWKLDLGMPRPTLMEPLLLGRDVYAAGIDEADGGHIVRVDLDTARPVEVARLGSKPTSWASDGRVLYVATEDGVQALDTQDGSQLWRAEHPMIAADQARVACQFAKVRDGKVFVACLSHSSDVGNPVYGEAGEATSVLFVRALDAEDGSESWLWANQPASQPGAPVPAPREASPTAAPKVTYLNGMALAGNAVLVAGIDGLGTGGVAQLATYGLDGDDGALLWHRTHSATDSSDNVRVFPGNAAEPAANAKIAYIKLDRVFAVNPVLGTTLWQTEIGNEDGGPDFIGSGFALSDEAFFAASRQSLYRFDAFDHRNGWRVTLDPTSDQVWGSTHLLLDGYRLYARAVNTSDLSGASGIHAVDASNGTATWTLTIPHDAPAVADLGHLMVLGDGVLVLQGVDGWLWVIGSTDASIRLDPHLDDAYPKPGSPVVLNLSSSRSGALGPVSEYRVTWGDRTTTPWSDDLVVEHTFDEVGDHEVTIEGRNAAGQTARSQITVHVGGNRPVEPNLIETAFARENQDLTFGILGLVTALAGGLLAMLRSRRRRGVLERELNAIEAAYERTRRSPPECEAALAERKAHVRGLLVDGVVDEAQLAVLERRVDELAGELRMTAIDERLQFLPHGMVLALRDMLDDGRINAWEREHIDRALDAAHGLTDDQRERARELIDTWYDRDSSG